MKCVRCIATAKDGRRCGRYAPADTQLCASHSTLTHPGIIPPPPDANTFDPKDELLRIAMDSRHGKQLEAIKLLREEDQICKSCQEAAQHNAEILQRQGTVVDRLRAHIEPIAQRRREIEQGKMLVTLIRKLRSDTVGATNLDTLREAWVDLHDLIPATFPAWNTDLERRATELLNDAALLDNGAAA